MMIPHFKSPGGGRYKLRKIERQKCHKTRKFNIDKGPWGEGGCGLNLWILKGVVERFLGCPSEVRKCKVTVAATEGVNVGVRENGGGGGFGGDGSHGGGGGGDFEGGFSFSSEDSSLFVHELVAQKLDGATFASTATSAAATASERNLL